MGKFYAQMANNVGKHSHGIPPSWEVPQSMNEAGWCVYISWKLHCFIALCCFKYISVFEGLLWIIYPYCTGFLYRHTHNLIHPRSWSPLSCSHVALWILQIHSQLVPVCQKCLSMSVRLADFQMMKCTSTSHGTVQLALEATQNSQCYNIDWHHVCLCDPFQYKSQMPVHQHIYIKTGPFVLFCFYFITHSCWGTFLKGCYI